MKKLFRFIRLYYREILRGLYFALAILLILFALPRERKFKYEFQRGMAWMHEDLVAPFDFPIYKTDSELISERNAILTNFKPFFKYDTTSVSEAIELFRSDFQKSWEGISANRTPNKKVINRVIEQIRLIHNEGVFQPNEFSDLRGKIQDGITVVFNNQAFDKPRDNVYQVSRGASVLNDVAHSIAQEVNGPEAKVLVKLSYARYIKPNLFYDAQTTLQVSSDMLANLSNTKGLIYNGERIIGKGEVVNADLFQILFSLKREFESRMNLVEDSRLLLAGQAIVITILFVILFLFLLNFRREILYNDSKIIFILLIITSITLISALLLRRDLISIYIIPFAIIPIFIRTFYDSRLALFIHLVTVFMVGFFVPNSFEFVFMHFIAGVVAIISLTKVYRRSKLFLSVGLIFLTYTILYLGIVLIQEGTPKAMNEIGRASCRERVS